MKTFIKNLKLVLLAALGGLAILTENTQAADGPLPPEVKKLVGMKTPPETNPGRIPDWTGLWGFAVGNDVYLDVLQQKETTIIAIKLINRKEKTSSILDARVIPGKLLRFYLKNGELKWRKNEKQWYRITNECSREGSKNRELIIGMWKFEPNSKCSDPSRLVKKAWLLNLENGRLTDIPTQGVSCREPDCGDDE